jgi:hypothetical protein
MMSRHGVLPVGAIGRPTAMKSKTDTRFIVVPTKSPSPGRYLAPATVPAVPRLDTADSVLMAEGHDGDTVTTAPRPGRATSSIWAGAK